MKKKTGKPKSGNGQDKKKPSRRKDIPGGFDLLKIANHLSMQANKAEKPEAWQAKCHAEARLLMAQVKKELEEGKNASGLLFKAIQMLREAGCQDDNVTLALFYHSFLHMKE